MARHECSTYTNGRDWAHCVRCDGRMHMIGCTSRRDPKKDCCQKRHERMAAAGTLRNAYAQGMYPDGTPEKVWGFDEWA